MYESLGRTASFYDRLMALEANQRLLRVYADFRQVCLDKYPYGDGFVKKDAKKVYADHLTDHIWEKPEGTENSRTFLSVSVYRKAAVDNKQMSDGTHRKYKANRIADIHNSYIAVVPVLFRGYMPFSAMMAHIENVIAELDPDIQPTDILYDGEKLYFCWMFSRTLAKKFNKMYDELIGKLKKKMIKAVEHAYEVELFYVFDGVKVNGFYPMPGTYNLGSEQFCRVVWSKPENAKNAFQLIEVLQKRNYVRGRVVEGQEIFTNARLNQMIADGLLDSEKARDFMNHVAEDRRGSSTEKTTQYYINNVWSVGNKVRRANRPKRTLKVQDLLEDFATLILGGYVNGYNPEVQCCLTKSLITYALISGCTEQRAMQLGSWLNHTFPLELEKHEMAAVFWEAKDASKGCTEMFGVSAVLDYNHIRTAVRHAEMDGRQFKALYSQDENGNRKTAGDLKREAKETSAKIAKKRKDERDCANKHQQILETVDSMRRHGYTLKEIAKAIGRCVRQVCRYLNELKERAYEKAKQWSPRGTLSLLGLRPGCDIFDNSNVTNPASKPTYFSLPASLLPYLNTEQYNLSPPGAFYALVVALNPSRSADECALCYAQNMWSVSSCRPSRRARGLAL